MCLKKDCIKENPLLNFVPLWIIASDDELAIATTVDEFMLVVMDFWCSEARNVSPRTARTMMIQDMHKL